LEIAVIEIFIAACGQHLKEALRGKRPLARSSQKEKGQGKDQPDSMPGSCTLPIDLPE
jgi:hypothetical protein